MEANSIQLPAVQTIEQIESADLLIGILADFNREDIAETCKALQGIPGAPRIVVLQHRSGSPSEKDAFDIPDQSPSISVVPWVFQGAGAVATPMETASSAFGSVFSTGEKLGARGCCIIASKMEDAPPNWISEMVEPLLDQSSDLIAPSYALRKLEGLLNHSIISPFTRCLYGKRIQNPMGPDFGISRRLSQQVLGFDPNIKAASNGMYLLALLAPLACSGDFKVRETYLGARIYPVVDWANISSLVADILGPVFLAMEKNAARWQRTRNSVPVEISNRRFLVAQSSNGLETGRLMNSFQLGVRDLREIWGLVLPPTTLFELGKLSRLSPEEFRMPDDLWVRIVYDFALAHRLQTINRDHLLRSMTPLYLGWVASHAHEIQEMDNAAVSQRLERLALAYEAQKPYLISRWRWPDRFNP